MNLPGRHARRAGLDLDDLAISVEDTHDLQIRTPRATHAVICMRHVVAERDALLADVATVTIDSHDSTMPRSISEAAMKIK